VVQLEVGFEAAGEPLVAGDLLAAVEDHEFGGVQQYPHRPADQPHRTE
jgi:hypothetical protein